MHTGVLGSTPRVKWSCHVALRHAMIFAMPSDKPRVNIIASEEQIRLWRQAAESGERPLPLPQWIRLKLDAAALADIEAEKKRTSK